MTAAQSRASLDPGAASLARLFGPTRAEPSSPRAAPDPVLRLSGDAADPERVQRLLLEFLAVLRSGPVRVHVDLLAVEGADSKLVACLVCVAGRARKSGCRVTVACTELVWRWISICRLDELFEHELCRAGANGRTVAPARPAA